MPNNDPQCKPHHASCKAKTSYDTKKDPQDRLYYYPQNLMMPNIISDPQNRFFLSFHNNERFLQLVVWFV